MCVNVSCRVHSPSPCHPSSLKDLEEVRTKFHQKLSWYRETVQHMEESKRLLKVSGFVVGRTCLLSYCTYV